MITLLALFSCTDKVTGDASDTGAIDPGDSGLVDSDCTPTDEVCDGEDNDCDGAVDEDATDATLYFTDGDGDGYGGGDGSLSCDEPPDSSTVGGDCDDADPLVNPGAQEVCDDDDVDEDCDGDADDADSDVDTSDGTRVHTDADGDGYGDPDDYWQVCDPGEDAVFDGTDCDDSEYSETNDCSAGFEGTYTGTFEVSGSASGISDGCTSTGSLDVDEDGQISGTMSCSFTYLGSQSADITGEIAEDESAEGELTVGAVFTDDWTGEWTEPGVLTGSFSGTTTYSGFDITYSGSFELER